MDEPVVPPDRKVETLDPAWLETRLREVARELLPDQVVDDLEVRHMSRVVTECALLLNDVYSDARIARIMQADRGILMHLIGRLIEQERRGEGEVLYRVRRLPEDVRLIGDKALFDLALLGLRQVKGYDLDQLGPRAYRAAGEVLQLLAEDRRLREFFKQNRLLMLPLEEEVVFLRQCSERFPVYATILKRMQHQALAGKVEDLKARVPLMAAAAEALVAGEAVASPAPEKEAEKADRYLEAVRPGAVSPHAPSREELISTYERIVLFNSVDMGKLKDALRSVVVDQERAVDALCDEFSLFAAGTRDPRKPPAYFLVGPTGVGKNHVVESLCRLLEGIWDVEVPLLTIEGPSYTYPSDINELRGATRGFIRSDEEGLLGAFHEKSSKSPFSVILVDEVEKAHAQLRTFFLSILDRGTTTDNRGRVLNFSNTMVFFTSNLGYSDAQQRSAPIGYMDDDVRAGVSDQDVRAGLRRALTPEFANRVRMIHFNRLTRASAERILALELERIAARYRDLHGLRVVIEPSAREELIRRGFSAVYGARHLAATLETVCNVEVAKKIRRDDRGSTEQRESLLAWLREVRGGSRVFDPEQVRERVVSLTRARLAYDTVRVVFSEGGFDYLSGSGDEG